MNKLSIFFITLCLLFSINLLSQEINISVVIPSAKSDCGVLNDLGYRYAWGNDDMYRIQKKTREEATEAFGKPKYSSSYSNFSWGDYLGSYMVIISATTTNYENCDKFKFGVGFGMNEVDALKRAKTSLCANNWSWNSKKPFKVELSELYEITKD